MMFLYFVGLHSFSSFILTGAILVAELRNAAILGQTKDFKSAALLCTNKRPNFHTGPSMRNPFISLPSSFKFG